MAAIITHLNIPPAVHLIFNFSSAWNKPSFLPSFFFDIYIIFTPWSFCPLSAKATTYSSHLPSSSPKVPVKAHDQTEAERSCNSSHLEMIRGFFSEKLVGKLRCMSMHVRPREEGTAGCRL